MAVAKPSITQGRLRWGIAGLLLAPLTFVMALDRGALTVAAPTIRHEYHFSLIQMSYLLTSFSWSYGLVQLFSGRLIERYGPRKMLGAASLFWSVLTLLTPLSSGFASLVAIRLLLGVGQGPDWPSSILALKLWFTRPERAKANSILLGGLYLGPIAAAPLTTFMILHFGWRAAFYAFGLVGVAIAFLWYIGFRDNPAAHPWIDAAEADSIAADREEAPVPAAHPAAKSVFKAALGSGRFWALGLQYGFLIMIQGFYNIWLPTYLVEVRHMTLASMGVYAALPWISLFVMVFVGGALSDFVLRHTRSIWAARVPAAIAGFFISAIALILATRVPQIWLMMVLLCISLGAIGLTQVSIWSAVQDMSGASTGVVTGWTNCWGNLSAAIGPVLTVYLVKWTGSWEGALLGIALAGLGGAVVWLFIRPERPLAFG